LRNRSEELFREFYFKLIDYFHPLLSVSRVKGVRFEQFSVVYHKRRRLFQP
jgi:hypothetical protein